MTVLPITLATASIVGLMLIWLSARVIASRVRNEALIGDENNTELLFAIRTHGNFIEYAPIFLILLGLLEHSGGNPTALMVLAGLFIVARPLHVLGMGPDANLKLRQIGTVLTFTVIIAASLYGLYLSFV
jgi:uncharacterized membrane protein YecN with MAPEG domain